VGLASIVNLANRYELVDSGIEAQWRKIFHTRPDRSCDPPGLLYNRHRLSFPGVRRLGRGGDHLPLSSADVKESAKLYLYSSSGPPWPVVG